MLPQIHTFLNSFSTLTFGDRVDILVEKFYSLGFVQWLLFRLPVFTYTYLQDLMVLDDFLFAH